jgi:hypothetical protein
MEVPGRVEHESARTARAAIREYRDCAVGRTLENRIPGSAVARQYEPLHRAKAIGSF